MDVVALFLVHGAELQNAMHAAAHVLPAIIDSRSQTLVIGLWAQVI